ncbi:hypothetical protein NEMBOFW57_010576 [Staphylotrichum longicolle]|uniref:NB-ARC domain-containing protein n=1 Tax=Staphylotrichum longicolle TaxID=669026 RepID=A0AAD4ERR1_9PEZI|nr:hypothetical protein NEMBOFW57_010576 [Staphylotrichum longicolle]
MTCLDPFYHYPYKGINEAGEESSSKLFWPNEYLTQDIPEARTWTYGYNADAVGGLFEANNKNSVSQHGRDFAVRVEREIRNEAIRRSEIASNLALLALQDSNKKIVKTLEVNSEILDNIHEEFKTIADQLRIRIHSFQEGRGVLGMKGIYNKVVDDVSSKLDLPRSLETVESIDANHMQMARCGDRADPRYRTILGVLQQFIYRTMVDESRGTMPCYFIPLHENRRFVGREKTLDTLKTKFFVGKEWRKAAVVGLGGVGKTQVALQLAYWAKKHQPDFSIFWVPALSKATFEQAFAAMARKLPIPSSGNHDDLRESARRYLSSEAAGPWLLVVDNADDADILFGSAGMRAPGGISRYLPESKDGLTLFTTRSLDIAVSVAGSDVVELHAMDPEEATAFLEKSLIQKDLLRDEAATGELLMQLTYLPLAITQAAAYINIKKIPLAEYARLLQGTQQGIISLMSKEFRDNTRYAGSQNAVATTWLVSFDQIRKSHKAAADLLSFISCIEPKEIPQSLLPDSASAEQLVDAIGTLCAYGFLTRRGDSKVFDMHGLHVAAFAPEALPQDESLWFASRAELAMAYIDNGQPKEAIVLSRQIVTVQAKTLAEDHPMRLEGQRVLAKVYQANGEIKEAIALLQQVVAIGAQSLPEDNHSRFTSQCNLAEAYLDNGQVEEAIVLFQRAIANKAKTLAEDHPLRLLLQHKLAAAYQANGQVEEAISLIQQVIAIEAKTLAEDHPERLTSQHALANAYLENGRVEEAIALLQHVVDIQNKIFAEDHSAQVTSQYSLGIAYLENGQVEEAILLLQQVVTMRAKTLPENHPSLLEPQQLLAMAQREHDRVTHADGFDSDELDLSVH